MRNIDGLQHVIWRLYVIGKSLKGTTTIHMHCLMYSLYRLLFFLRYVKYAFIIMHSYLSCARIFFVNPYICCTIFVFPSQFYFQIYIIFYILSKWLYSYSNVGNRTMPWLEETAIKGPLSKKINWSDLPSNMKNVFELW